MKYEILISFCILVFLNNVCGQVLKVMPADADDFYNSSMPLLRPQVKAVVLQTAKAMNHRKANADSLYKTLKINASLKGMTNRDIDGIIVLIMVQASKNADSDLKNIVMEISHKSENENHPKVQQIPKAASTSKEEMIDLQKSKLQMLIDHKSNMAEEVTFVMQKISGSQQNIIENLK